MKRIHPYLWLVLASFILISVFYIASRHPVTDRYESQKSSNYSVQVYMTNSDPCVDAVRESYQLGANNALMGYMLRLYENKIEGRSERIGETVIVVGERMKIDTSAIVEALNGKQ